MTEQPFFLPYQKAWIDDDSPLKIIEKSRQIGITYADAFDTVIKASRRSQPQDVWVSSRDEPCASVVQNPGPSTLYPRRTCSADFQVCCVAGFQTRNAERAGERGHLKTQTMRRPHLHPCQ